MYFQATSKTLKIKQSRIWTKLGVDIVSGEINIWYNS